MTGGRALHASLAPLLLVTSTNTSRCRLATDSAKARLGFGPLGQQTGLFGLGFIVGEKGHIPIEARNIVCGELPFREIRKARDQRNALLAVLDPLPPGDWQRTGTLVGAGRPVDLTAHSYAERLARHERPHIKQIAKIVAALEA